MRTRSFWRGAVIVLLLLPGYPALADVSPKEDASARCSGAKRELKASEDLLAAKREELAKLRHRWVVFKGRTPTEQEIKEFEEKLAKGEAKPQENPYFNKTPLSTPAPARAAYYRKLEEVRQEEQRVRRLGEEIAELELQGCGR